MAFVGIDKYHLRGVIIHSWLNASTFGMAGGLRMGLLAGVAMVCTQALDKLHLPMSRPVSQSIGCLNTRS